MDCRNALLLISPHLDGALTNEENAALVEHLAGCESCARELELQRRLCGALREMEREDIKAPPELCSQVMARLQAERRPVLWRLPGAWRRAMAAAAAILLIAGGSAGYTSGLRLADIGKMIGLATPASPVNTETPGGISIADKAPVEGTLPVDTTAQNPGENGVPGNVQQGNPAEGTGDGSGADVPDSNGDNAGKGIATPTGDIPLALLSNEMKINSTVLTVAVDDLTGARAKAVALAAGAGASTQVFPEQGDGKKVVVVRLAADHNKAPGLVERLGGVGLLVDRRDESRDLTSTYNETLVQYYDLQSRISTAGGADKHQMEVQAESYRQQLGNWKNEAGKWVITLWLEGK